MIEHYRFYDQGWNDFASGKAWPGTAGSTINYRDGWHDARDYEQTHGKKPDPI